MSELVLNRETETQVDGRPAMGAAAVAEVFGVQLKPIEFGPESAPGGGESGGEGGQEEEDLYVQPIVDGTPTGEGGDGDGDRKGETIEGGGDGGQTN